MFNPDDDFDDFGQEFDKQPLASNAETIEPANAKPHQTASDARRPTQDRKHPGTTSITGGNRRSQPGPVL